MATMVVAIAGMMIAMGIIALQKSMQVKVGFKSIPSIVCQIDIKAMGADDSTYTKIFNNKDAAFIGAGLSISDDTLIFTEAFAASYTSTIGVSFTLRITNLLDDSGIKITSSGINATTNPLSLILQVGGAGIMDVSGVAAISTLQLTFAKYNAYSVTTSPQSGNFTFSGEQKAVEGEDYTANVRAEEGYNITIIITKDSGAVQLVQGTDYTYDLETGLLIIKKSVVTGDIFISCATSIKEYIITYDLNGGTLGEGVVNPTTYTAVTGTFVINNPTRPYAFFIGWLVNDAIEPVLNLTIEKGTCENLNLVAVYVDYVDISFVAMDSSGVVNAWGGSLLIDREIDANGIEHVNVNTEYSATITSTDSASVHITGVEVTGIEEGGYKAQISDDSLSMAFQILDWGKITGNNIEVVVKYAVTCVLPNTLVTLADGTQKEIQYVDYDDEVLCWDFYNGRYTSALPVLMLYCGYGYYEVINLVFSDGTEVDMAGYHMFLDADSKEWVQLTALNVQKYVGHNFIKVDQISENTYKTVKLVQANTEMMYTCPMSVLPAEHFNFIANDMFNMSLMLGAENLFCVFDIKDNMMYDKEEIESDIANYGLYTYDEWSMYVNEWQFNAFGVPYMKIPVGKGLSSYDYIINRLTWLIPTA